MKKKYLEKIPHDAFSHSSSVFFAHADNVLSLKESMRLPYEQENLQTLLNLFALFSEHLYILDVSLLYNQHLREMLMQNDYSKLLSQGIIVPMLRSPISSFKDLEEQLYSSGTWGHPDRAVIQNFSEFLDDNTSTVLKTEQDLFGPLLEEHYEQTLMNTEFLKSEKLATIQGDLFGYVRDWQKKHPGAKLRRSVFFQFADILSNGGHPKYTSRIRRLSSAIYNKTFYAYYGIKPALPHVYLETVENIGGAPIISSNMKIERLVDSAPGISSLQIGDLRSLKPKDIIRLRKIGNQYFVKAKEFNSIKLANYLEKYLVDIRKEAAGLGLGYTKKFNIKKQNLELIRWVGRVGSAGLGLVATLPIHEINWIALAFGILWTESIGKIEANIEGKIKNDDKSVIEKWEKIKKAKGTNKPVISISEKIGSLHPPEF